jgi:hypothetical protein
MRAGGFSISSTTLVGCMQGLADDRREGNRLLGRVDKDAATRAYTN